MLLPADIAIVGINDSNRDALRELLNHIPDVVDFLNRDYVTSVVREDGRWLHASGGPVEDVRMLRRHCPTCTRWTVAQFISYMREST